MVFLSEVHLTHARSAQPCSLPLAGGGSCNGAEGQIKMSFTLAYSFSVPIQFPPGNAAVSMPACRLFSLAYMKLPKDNCLTLFRQLIWCAFNFALLRAERSKAARMPRMAMTTSNSTSVKARSGSLSFVFLDFDMVRCFTELSSAFSMHSSVLKLPVLLRWCPLCDQA